MKKYLISLITFLLIYQNYSQTGREVKSSLPVEFTKEKIEIFLSDEIMKLKGTYYFKNLTSSFLKTSVFYPFPIDKEHLYPTEIKIYKWKIDKKNKVNFVKSDKGVLWTVEIEANKITKYIVIYKQPIKTKNATYILTTTQAWNKPLEYAKFIIHIPKIFKNIEIPYSIDKIFSKGENIIYEFTRTNFLPTKDLTICWQ